MLKRGKDIDKIERVVDLLQSRQPLPPRYRRIRSRGCGPGIGIAMSSRIGCCSIV